MNKAEILVVDDEKNIRMTLSRALETIAESVDTAVNGEDALEKIREKDYDLVLLDLKMPGMGGMEVLRRLREIRPEVGVIILTAHGSIESAVEAMKLGAVDFLQKPFAPEEIRRLVSTVLDRGAIDARTADDYHSHIELAKRFAAERRFDTAVAHVRKAISLDASRADAFNLLGALLEINGERAEAQKNYRVAISLDPTHDAARKNLERSTGSSRGGDIILGEEAAEE